MLPYDYGRRLFDATIIKLKYGRRLLMLPPTNMVGVF